MSFTTDVFIRVPNICADSSFYEKLELVFKKSDLQICYNSARKWLPSELEWIDVTWYDRYGLDCDMSLRFEVLFEGKRFLHCELWFISKDSIESIFLYSTVPPYCLGGLEPRESQKKRAIKLQEVSIFLHKKFSATKTTAIAGEDENPWFYFDAKTWKTMVIPPED